MTYEDKQGLAMLGWLILLYALSKRSEFFNTIWKFVKLFIIITLTIVTAGMIWKWVKGLFK